MRKLILILISLILLVVSGCSSDIYILDPNPPYAHITNDLSDTISISQANVWTEANTTIWTLRQHELITFEDNHSLKVSSSGIYLVDISASLQGATTGDKIGTSVMVNHIAQSGGHAHSTIGNPNDQVGMATSYILNLTKDDEVSVAVINHNAARDLQIIHSSMTITRIKSH